MVGRRCDRVDNQRVRERFVNKFKPVQSNAILAKCDQLANITPDVRHRRQPIYDLFNCRKVLGKVKIKTQPDGYTTPIQYLVTALLL
jgi:hypothetical protein